MPPPRQRLMRTVVRESWFEALVPSVSRRQHLQVLRSRTSTTSSCAAPAMLVVFRRSSAVHLGGIVLRKSSNAGLTWDACRAQQPGTRSVELMGLAGGGLGPAGWSYFTRWNCRDTPWIRPGGGCLPHRSFRCLVGGWQEAVGHTTGRADRPGVVRDSHIAECFHQSTSNRCAAHRRLLVFLCRIPASWRRSFASEIEQGCCGCHLCRGGAGRCRRRSGERRRDRQGHGGAAPHAVGVSGMVAALERRLGPCVGCMSRTVSGNQVGRVGPRPFYRHQERWDLVEHRVELPRHAVILAGQFNRGSGADEPDRPYR